MANSLSPVTPIPIFSRNKITHLPSSATLKVYACSSTTGSGQILEEKYVQRRTIALGLVGAMLALGPGNGNAWAAGKRPPPRPPSEKKDPNVSGVMAKVMASKKRKEALKETIAKLREEGKKIEEPAP